MWTTPAVVIAYRNAVSFDPGNKNMKRTWVANVTQVLIIYG